MISIVRNGDMSENLTTRSINLDPHDMLTIHAFWTGSPIGTLSLELSLDGTNWLRDTASDHALVGAPDTVGWRLIWFTEKYARIVYTRTGGDGVLTINGRGERM